VLKDPKEVKELKALRERKVYLLEYHLFLAVAPMATRHFLLEQQILFAIVSSTT
jgi:hypothetical protein